jgi:hypothetical protein
MQSSTTKASVVADTAEKASREKPVFITTMLKDVLFIIFTSTKS